ncbi:hypothetical protein AB0O34_15905 [Sphaerisporangium sp. NPDC088356]|uniref:hypothetical protein n=1 Tax=Sphaerisporangium sp. NPDC088356 TaxID=3154871 RepID=UPI003428B023
MTCPDEHTHEPAHAEDTQVEPVQTQLTKVEPVHVHDEFLQVEGEPPDPYGFPATAGRGVGGYIPARRAILTPPVPRELDVLVEQQLAVLSQTYPAWRITRVRRPDGTPGGWWATRYAPLTPAQRATGLVASIARGDAIALVMELAVQDEIAHQNGYSDT